MSTTTLTAPELGDTQVIKTGDCYVAETYACVKGKNQWIALCDPMRSLTEAFNKITLTGRYLP
jgi:hypothetical protein